MAKLISAVIIPARFDSIRFPGKPLAKICHKPMIQWVYEKAIKSNVDKVIVATDNPLIEKEVKNFGGEVILTSKNHRNGTSRVEEANRMIKADLVINLQGDEPLIPINVINEILEKLKETNNIVTVGLKNYEEKDFLNKNIVKIVLNKENEALYFSRSPIPYTKKLKNNFISHWGIYAYKKDILSQLIQYENSHLESSESLEQLTFLYHKHKISVLVKEGIINIGVDVPEDIKKVEAILNNG